MSAVGVATPGHGLSAPFRAWEGGAQRAYHCLLPRVSTNQELQGRGTEVTWPVVWIPKGSSRLGPGERAGQQPRAVEVSQVSQVSEGPPKAQSCPAPASNTSARRLWPLPVADLGPRSNHRALAAYGPWLPAWEGPDGTLRLSFCSPPPITPGFYRGLAQLPGRQAC